jgi:hypothetical protein
MNCQLMNKQALGNFKGSHRDGGRAVNLHASPFIKDLSNETIFIQIHRDGQYQRELKYRTHLPCPSKFKGTRQ